MAGARKVTVLAYPSFKTELVETCKDRKFRVIVVASQLRAHCLISNSRKSSW